MIGTPNIMAKVSRSRRSCWISLTMMARRRCHMSAVERVVARPSHQMDEYVFERRLGLFPFEAIFVPERLDRAHQRVAIGAADMERRAERRRGGDARRVAQFGRQAVGAGAAGDEGGEARLRDDLGRA